MCDCKYLSSRSLDTEFKCDRLIMTTRVIYVRHTIKKVEVVKDTLWREDGRAVEEVDLGETHCDG